LKNSCDKLRLKFKNGWWRYPPYPLYFFIGFRRFTKMTFVRSGGNVPPKSPRGATPEVKQPPTVRKEFCWLKLEFFHLMIYQSQLCDNCKFISFTKNIFEIFFKLCRIYTCRFDNQVPKGKLLKKYFLLPSSRNILFLKWKESLLHTASKKFYF